MLVGWLVYPLFLGQSATPSIPYSFFLAQVDNGNVSEALIEGDQISGRLDQSASIKLTPDADRPTEVTSFRTVFPAEVGQQGRVGSHQSSWPVRPSSLPCSSIPCRGEP